MKRLLKIAVVFAVLLAAQSAHAEWKKQNTNSFAWYKDIYFYNDQRGWIIGTDGVMLHSEDGGSTWIQPKKFTTDKFIQIHFTDEMTGWLLCERNVYARGNNPTSYLRKTVDGGRTWEKIEFEDAGRERVTRLLFHADGRANAFGEGGVFFKLQEDGKTWKKSKTAIHYLLLDGMFSDETVGAIVGTAGTIMFTEDAGFTWEKASLLGESDTRFNSIFFAGTKGAWAVGNKGRIFRSNGGARLWRQQNSTVTADLNDVYFTSPTNGWAVGEYGIIVRTRDGGNTWYPVPSQTTHTLEKIVFANGCGWTIGFGGTLLIYEEGRSNTERAERPILMKRG